ncbi:MAG TPA: hypothetical protein PLH62_08165 [Ferruginibacter sp.]|nr:hypothetical protein [Ferruginibacter sp.]HNH20676.1 hypothetical protein [Ferruginibacter sp.]
MQTQCIFCNTPVVLVHVHGHYQCPVCKTNALPCCDGDNCDNFLLVRGDAGSREKEKQSAFPVNGNASESSNR